MPLKRNDRFRTLALSVAELQSGRLHEGKIINIGEDTLMNGIQHFCSLYEQKAESERKSFQEIIDRQMLTIKSIKNSPYRYSHLTYKGVQTIMYEQFCGLMWSVAFPYEAALYEACQKDVGRIKNVVFQQERLSSVYNATVGGGGDHCSFYFDIMKAFSVNDFKRMNVLMPLECGISRIGYWVNKMCTNLLMAIYYESPEHIEFCREQCEAAAKRKETLYFKAQLNCLIAIFKQDVQAFNEHLANVLKGLGRVQALGVGPMDRVLNLEAHGLYNLARWKFEGEKKAQLIMPQHRAFWPELVESLGEPDEEIEPYYTYENELAFFNRLLSDETPIRVKGTLMRKSVDNEAIELYYGQLIEQELEKWQ